MQVTLVTEGGTCIKSYSKIIISTSSDNCQGSNSLENSFELGFGPWTRVPVPGGNTLGKNRT